ncbi:DMT family transporter [Devosia sp. CN2-171]|uniref:DMT family transporter n=1 Tax=Devosia sp. CN2-171 TaxID=3400909 RepID=UPI003BF867B2
MTQPSPLSDRRVVLAVAVLCCFLWGSAVPALKIGYGVFGIVPSDTATLLLFAGVRFSLAGALLLGYALATGKPVGLDRRTLGRVSLLGLVSTAGQYLFYYVGLAHSTGVKTSITTSSSTFFSAILAHWLYTNDKLTGRRLVGCLLGFAGVVAVNLSGAGLDLAFSVLGEGFILIAALLFSLGGIYGKRVSGQLDVMVMTGWQLGLGGLMLAVAGLATGGHLGGFGWEGVLLLAYLAALSSAAFALWALLLKHNPVGSVAIFNCLIPVFGVSLSGLVLGESFLEWKNLVALALVSVGIWLATARKDSVVGRPSP